MKAPCLEGVGLAWTIALVLAVLPLLGVNGYVYEVLLQLHLHLLLLLVCFRVSDPDKTLKTGTEQK